LCGCLDNDCSGTVDEEPAGNNLCPCTKLTYGGHTYLFCDGPLHWHGAHYACRENGYHLAQPDDVSENAFIGSEAAALVAGDIAWIGANDIQSEGSFVWDDQSTPVIPLSSWGGSQPNNRVEIDDLNGAGEDCVYINGTSSDQWFDYWCISPYGYVCEADPNRTQLDVLPVGPVIFSEDFSYANNAAWPTDQWVSNVSDAAGTDEMVEVLNGQGRMWVDDDNSEYARATLLDMPAIQDVEVLMRIFFLNDSNLPRLRVSLRTSATWPERWRPADGVVVTLNGGGMFEVERFVGATENVLGTATNSVGALAGLYLRFRAEGTQIKAKIWADGDTEPTGWDIEATDSDPIHAGLLTLNFHQTSGTAAQTVFVDNVSLVTAPLAPP
jgi:hypothetical protein